LLLILAVLLSAAAPVSVLAVDSAAPFSAGERVARRETRIAMANESFRIGVKKVVAS